MKESLFIFSLLIIGGCSMQWKKIYDLKEWLIGYNQSPENVYQFTQQTLYNTKLKAAQFIDQLSSNYLLKTSELNETECYKSFFDPKRMRRSFESEIIRSQIPLENLLAELRGKLDGVNDTINMCQDLADSKYSVCKAMNKSATCEEDTDLWLDGIISTVRCQFSPTCHSHVLSKRSVVNDCPVGKYVCDSSKCISPTSVCNGINDCDDETDESDCCDSSRYHCRNRNNCIYNTYLCNGQDDCGDGSDELHCAKSVKNCSIENGMHKCDLIKCIGLDLVCDGRRDCNDGSDEGYHCGKGLCPEECTKKGGVCFHGPTGPLCFAQCPLGTFESPEGCTALPHPTSRTVIELLEEIPKLTYSQNAKFTYLKMKAVVTVSRMMTDVFKCLDPNYPGLAKVRSFPINSQTDDESSYTIKTEGSTEGTTII